MKRSIVFLLAISLILCLLSCEEDKNPDKTVDTAAKTTEPSAATTTTSPYGDESLIPTDESLFEYEARNIGTVAIKKYIGEEADVVIPAEIGGKKVIEIGEQSFLNNYIIKSVALPNGIETIETQAFMGCESLERAILNDDLKIIKGAAFEGCCSLTDINLPENLEHIQACAFSLCDSLKYISIPPKCLDETSLFLLDSSGIESIYIAEGAEYLPRAMLSNSKIKEISLPSSMKVLDGTVFISCKELTDVHLNEGLVTIGGGTFWDCSKLKEVIVPASATDVHESSFMREPPADGEEYTMAVKFEGDAPKNFVRMSEDRRPERNIKIFFHKDAKGFTYPEWNGYPTEIW